MDTSSNAMNPATRQTVSARQRRGSGAAGGLPWAGADAMSGLPRRRVTGSASRGPGAGRLPRPEGPLLEGAAAPVLGDTHDPQVAVLLVDGVAVTDLHPHHRGVALDRHDLTGHVEHLAGILPLPLPHPRDGGQADDRFPVGPLPV